MRSVLCWSIEPLRVGVWLAEAKGSPRDEVGVCGDVGCWPRSFASSASYSAHRPAAALARWLRMRTSLSSSAMRACAVASSTCDLSSGDEGGRSQPQPGQLEPRSVRSVGAGVVLVAVTTMVADIVCFVFLAVYSYDARSLARTRYKSYVVYRLCMYRLIGYNLGR